jgi:ribose 5-phosphate isomerase A
MRHARVSLADTIAAAHRRRMGHDADKKAAALAAVAEVKDGMLVGLGTGSTAAFAIAEIGRLCAQGLEIKAVATSLATEALAREAGIPIVPLESVAVIDLTIDGADEVDPQLRAIKGAGGAMLREKIVAAAARRMVVIADKSKQVAQLGEAPLPVEVLPIALGYVTHILKAVGGLPILRGGEDSPARTDQGNIILDCSFGPIDDPTLLAQRLSSIAGVMGHGLFLDEVDALYVANEGVVDRIERPVVAETQKDSMTGN